jgi:N-acylneuraminate cytidylyltransferase
MSGSIAIITARGGSKRIPGKNIRSFFGQPIIQYPIEAALHSGCFDEVMVSTDDQGIANIALSLGAQVPFMRSKETADDHATTADVLYEVLKKYESLGRKFRYGCCIYPTNPFLTPQKLKNAFEILKESGSYSVVPVVKFGASVYRSFKIENGILTMNWPEYVNMRSQDLPIAYHDCGQFYFFRTEYFMEKKKLFTEWTTPMEMPLSEVQDIDTEEDWKMAELKYALLKKQANG